MELTIIYKFKDFIYYYLIEEHNPDYIVIWETWLEKKPANINPSYEIFQTKYAKYQGVWIISKKKLITKIHTNNEQFIIVAEINIDSNPHFIIGVYFQHKSKRKILWKLAKLMNRIKLTYINPKIVLCWDLNPDKEFNPELLEIH